MKAIRLLSIALLLAGLFACSEEVPESADVVLETTAGNIYLSLSDSTPRHRDNFLKLVREGYYDSTSFHRVIPRFMVQGGDPSTRDTSSNTAPGSGGPGYTIPPEFNPHLVHVRGALAAARQDDRINPGRESSGSQFYIVTGEPVSPMELDQVESKVVREAQRAHFSYQYMQREQFRALRETNMDSLMRKDPDKGREMMRDFTQKVRKAFEQEVEEFSYTPRQEQLYDSLGGAPHLDMQYTVFGKVVGGMEVVEEIERGPTGPGDVPEEPVYIIRTRIISAGDE